MAEQKKKTTKKPVAAKGKTYTAKKEPEKKESAKAPAGKDTPFVRFLVAFFAIFLIITFFPGIDSGFLGGIREILTGLFGFGYYLFPFFLLLWVIFWKRDTENGVFLYKSLLLLGVFLCTLAIVHLISVKAAAPEQYSDAVKAFKELFEKGKELKTGGAIGGGFCALLSMAIGWVASCIFFVLGLFVCTVLYFGSTPGATLRAVRNWAASLREKKQAQAEEAEEEKVPAPKQKKEPKPVPEDEEAKEKKKQISSVLVDVDEEDDLRTEQNGQRKFDLPEQKNDEFTPFDLPNEPVINVTTVPADDDDTLTVTEDVPAEQGVEEPLPEELPPEDEETLPIEETVSEEPAAEEAPAEGEEKENMAIPAEPKVPYVFPPISLLADADPDSPRPTAADINAVSRKLEAVLDSFKVKARVIGASFGPTVTRYEVQPETGVRVKQIANLADDIALHLAATSTRIENIPGKSAIGIEIPNRAASTVRLRTLINDPAFKNSKSKLITALGEDVSGEPVYLDIGKMPHLLIAGATGMGKSVCMNSLIVSLLYHASPDEVKFIMIDPKKVEMADYNGIPHLLVPVINEPKKAAGTLNWACVEMEKRYELIQEVAAKNLAEYNAIVKDDPEREQIPSIVIFIDELADLMMTAPDDVENSICRLAQKARAAGIHLVIGTQRPSVDVITGLIKANVPSRISFKVASQVDSRTILDMAGAEKLLGRGDMLFYPVGAMKPIRVQGAFVDGKSEVVALTQFIKQASAATYDETIISEIEKEAMLCGTSKHGHRSEDEAGGEDIRLDEKFYEALELAIDSNNISTSMLQTRLSLGYARAARIVSVMEQKGYIGNYDTTTKTRRIIITREELMELKMGKAGGDEN